MPFSKNCPLPISGKVRKRLSPLKLAHCDMVRFSEFKENNVLRESMIHYSSIFINLLGDISNYIECCFSSIRKNIQCCENKRFQKLRGCSKFQKLMQPRESEG